MNFMSFVLEQPIYFQKSKQFETDEESGSGSDADDGPNSSLALRDELQHSQNKSNEEYLSECDCECKVCEVHY